MKEDMPVDTSLAAGLVRRADGVRRIDLRPGVLFTSEPSPCDAARETADDWKRADHPMLGDSSSSIGADWSSGTCTSYAN